jgi:Rod binding domain-containing protein
MAAWRRISFEDMLTEERSKIMAKTAGFGLADTLYRQLATDQLAQQKTSQEMQLIAGIPRADALTEAGLVSTAAEQED